MSAIIAVMDGLHSCSERAQGIFLAAGGLDFSPSDKGALQRLVLDLIRNIAAVAEGLKALPVAENSKHPPQAPSNRLSSLRQLETPVFDAKRSVTMLALLMEAELKPFGIASDDMRYCRLQPWEYEALLFGVDQARGFVEHLHSVWEGEWDKQSPAKPSAEAHS